jgi:hypothetical protein
VGEGRTLPRGAQQVLEKRSIGGPVLRVALPFRPIEEHPDREVIRNVLKSVGGVRSREKNVAGGNDRLNILG